MQSLQLGSRNAEVMFLQRLLNKKGASPAVTEDGDFGAKTRTAVISFQTKNSIKPANGVVGPMTWTGFGFLVSHSHNTQLFGQTNDMTCWSAAATMMLGSNRSIDAGAAKVNPDGSLNTRMENIELFASSLGWSIVNQISAPSTSTLISALARGPICIFFAGHHFVHAVVGSAIYSDRDNDGSGTVLRIHDPWPKNIGTVYASPYVNREVTIRSIPARPKAQIQYMMQA
jgi:peptidoglycan hydrolase-like protein with peptidoglycan-binding domain